MENQPSRRSRGEEAADRLTAVVHRNEYVAIARVRVTHEREVAKRAGRTTQLRDGLVVDDTRNSGGRDVLN